MTEGKPTGEGESDLAVVRLAQEIRRRRTAERLSQSDLAVMIGYSPQYVSLAERPRKGLPSANLVTAIDNALGAGGALVELHRQAKVQQQALRTSRAPEQAPSLPAASASANTHAGELERVDDTKRRQLLTSAAAITFGAALDQPVARIIAQADDQRVPATVRAGDVRDLRATVAMLEDWDHRAGGVAVRHHILGALRWGTGLLDGSCTPDVRRALAATVAQLADLAAWATFDAGRYDQARDLFLLGLHAASESGDLGIRAHVATGLARQEIHLGNTDGALELVQLAHIAADTLTPNGVSMLHTVKALAYGKKGDNDQCRRCTELAADSYRPETTADDPPWLQFFTPAKLTGDSANAMFDLLIASSPLLGQAETTPNTSRARTDLVERLSETVNGYPHGRPAAKPSPPPGWLPCSTSKAHPRKPTRLPGRR